MSQKNPICRDTWPSLINFSLIPLLLICQNSHATEVRNRQPMGTEYRYELIQEEVPRYLKDTFVATTFSGGGMRAASLAYGALKALRETKFNLDSEKTLSIPPNRQTLLSEVDFVSSVSGGSVTAAYWAIHGTTSKFEDFEDKFLKGKVQLTFLNQLLNPFNLANWVLTNSSRTDELMEYFSDNVLDQTTYQELLNRTLAGKDRPYLVINATDMNTRTHFPFIQLQFDLICLELNNLEIATALAASAAYPVVFPAIVLDNERTKDPECDRRKSHSDIVEDAGRHDSLVRQWDKHVEDATNDREITRKSKNQTTEDYNNRKGNLEGAEVGLRLAKEALNSAFNDMVAVGKRYRRKQETLVALGIPYMYAIEHENERLKEYTYATRKTKNDIEEMERDIRELEIRKKLLDSDVEDIRRNYSSYNIDWFQRTFDKARQLPKNLWNWVTIAYRNFERDVKEMGLSKTKKEYVSVSSHLDYANANSDINAQIYSDEKRERMDDSNGKEIRLSDLIEDFEKWTNEQSLPVYAKGMVVPSVEGDGNDVRGVKTVQLDMQEDMIRLKDRIDNIEGEVTRSIGLVRFIADKGELNTGDEEGLKDILDFFNGLAGYVDWQRQQTDALEDEVQRIKKMLYGLTEHESGSTYYVYELRRLRAAVIPLIQHSTVAADMQSVGTNWTEALWRIGTDGADQQKVASLRSELEPINKYIITKGNTLQKLKKNAGDQERVLGGRLDYAKKLVRETRAWMVRVRGEVDRLAGDMTKTMKNLERTRRVKKYALERVNSERRELKRMEVALRDLEEQLEKAERRKQAILEDKVKVEAIQTQHRRAVDNYEVQEFHYRDAGAKYVHLMDGGAADNIGFTPLVELLNSFYSAKKQVVDEVDRWKAETEYVVAILVDARASRQETFSESGTAPGAFDSLLTTIDTAIDGKSFLMTRELERVTEDLINKKAIQRRFLIKVAFDNIEKFGEDGSLTSCRYAYRGIPTNWDLSNEVVDALVEMGKALVLNSKEYGELVDQFPLNAAFNIKSVESVCNDYEGTLRKEFKEKPKVVDTSTARR